MQASSSWSGDVTLFSHPKWRSPLPRSCKRSSRERSPESSMHDSGLRSTALTSPKDEGQRNGATYVLSSSAGITTAGSCRRLWMPRPGSDGREPEWRLSGLSAPDSGRMTGRPVGAETRPSEHAPMRSRSSAVAYLARTDRSVCTVPEGRRQPTRSRDLVGSPAWQARRDRRAGVSRARSAGRRSRPSARKRGQSPYCSRFAGSSTPGCAACESGSAA
jgi:hypothetical protein